MADRPQPEPATASAAAAIIGAHFRMRDPGIGIVLAVQPGAVVSRRDRNAGCTMPRCTPSAPVMSVPAFIRIRDIDAFPADLMSVVINSRAWRGGVQGRPLFFFSAKSPPIMSLY